MAPGSQIRMKIQTCQENLPCDEKGKLRWLVDISIADTVVARNVEVTDPLTAESHVKSRWYLERYLHQNPYEELHSQEARRLLTAYSAEILEQLQLISLVETQIDRDKNEGWELLIEVINSEASPHTIHQLFWELLENPKLFHAEVQTVTVVRSLQGAETQMQPTREVAFQQHESTINILLVVARDTNRNAALYDDISPFLATDILLNIRRDLERNHKRVHMNIEIVRPGTLKAFEDHLATSERRHGPGYFHVVHFDLHGKVGARSGALEKKKYAFLYFSHPTEERTKPERVQKVASILQRYQVPFVVLNACESARAGLGDDANIAKVFCKGGVRNVVAMSFKISSSAASLFLREFYASLLVTACSFSTSASRARASLRCLPERSARFGLRKPLMDWFVPVVYGSVAGSVIEINPPAVPQNSPPLIGRDFDVLRFERSLMQNRLLYLYGPRASGKSSFVRYVSRLWQETSRVEAVLYLDMAKESVESLTDLIRVLIKTLSENLVQTGSKFVVSDHILDIWLSDKAGLVCVFLDILRKIPTLIIFDHLNVSHSNTMKGAMSKPLKAIFNELAKTLLDFVHTCPPDQQTYVVLIGCRSVAWAQEKLGCNVSNGVFELAGLQIADAIEMIQGMRGDSAGAGKEMMDQDMDSMELIVNLFQGLPGALELLEDVRVPLDVLYDRLRSFPRMLESIDIHGGPHLREISDLVDGLPDYYQPLISLLGSFWYEGGHPLTIASLFSFFTLRAFGTSVLPDQHVISTFHKIFESLQDLGYLDQYNSVPGSTGPIGPMSIHPMLSIHYRLSQPHGNRYSSPSVTEHAKTESPDKISKLILRPEWLDLFIISVSQTVQLRSRAPIEPGKRSDYLYELGTGNFSNVLNCIDIYGTTNLPNVLNCIDICIREKSDLPLECWPLDAFIKIAWIMSDVAPVVEFRLFTQRFEALLAAFFDSLGSLAVPPHYQVFTSSAYLFLVSAHNAQGTSSLEVIKNLVNRGLKVFEATKIKYGSPSDYEVLFRWGFLHMFDAILNVDLRLPQEVRKSWQQAQKLMGQGVTGPADDPSASKRDVEVIEAKGFVEGFYQLLKENSTAQSPTDGSPTLDLAMYEPMRAIGAYMEDLISGMERDTEPESRKSLFTGPNRGMLQVWRKITALADRANERLGLSKRTPRVMQNFLATNAEDRFGEGNMLSRLERLETSADIGDWSDAVDQHRFFISAALINLDVDSIMPHVDAMLEIYNRSPSLSPYLQKVQEFKDFITPVLPDFKFNTTPTDGGQADIEPPEGLGYNWFLQKLHEMGSESKDAARLHELLLRQQKSGIVPGMDKDSHERLAQAFVQTPRIHNDYKGSIKGMIECYELGEELQSAVAAGDWQKCVTITDHQAEVIAHYFGGELAIPTGFQEAQKFYSWIAASSPLFDQFDEAIKGRDSSLASSIFASITEIMKECPQISLQLAEEQTKSSRLRLLGLKILNESDIYRNAANTGDWAGRTSDQKNELLGMIDEFCGSHDGDEADSISKVLKEFCGFYGADKANEVSRVFNEFLEGHKVFDEKGSSGQSITPPDPS